MTSSSSSPLLKAGLTQSEIRPANSSEPNFWGGVLLGAQFALNGLLQKAAQSRNTAPTLSTASTKSLSIFEPDRYPTVSRESMRVKPHQVRIQAGLDDLALDALNVIQQRNSHRRDQELNRYRQPMNASARLFNEGTKSQGVSYPKTFHENDYVQYPESFHQTGLGAGRFMSASATPAFISETLVDPNLGQKPVSIQDRLRAQQAEVLARETQSAGMTQSLSLPRNDQGAREPLKAGVRAIDVNSLVEKAFADPANSKQDIIQQSKAGRLDESRLAQVELNADAMLHRGEITEAQHQEIALSAKMLFAGNWLRYEGKVNQDGTILYRGITMEPDIAAYAAYADVQNYCDKDTRLSQPDLAKTVEDLVQGAANALEKEFETLKDPNTPILRRVLTVGGLGIISLAAGSIAIEALPTWVLLTAIAGTVGLTGIGLWNARKKKILHLSPSRIKEISTPVELEDKGQNDDPKEKRCQILHEEDMDECEAKFPFENGLYSQYRFSRCRASAIVREAECRKFGIRFTPLDTWPE